jgi:hypothetical protein
MAKKPTPPSQRVRKPTTTARRRSKITAPPPTPEKQAEAFKEEYAYVLKDLRHVFILAGVMFVLLIVLNLVLR